MMKLFLLRRRLPELSMLLILVCLGLPAAQGETSLRRCMVLPITDNVKGAMGYKVFEEVESYLKESKWCYYHPNSDLINVLINYKDRLSTYLDNVEVRRLVAQKTSSGSIIRIKLTREAKGTDIAIEIYGENGEDLFFKEKTRVNRDDIKLIAQVIKNWLEEYNRSIPYEGLIIGVLGKQFTFDIGEQSNVGVGDVIMVRRPLKKKRHPLLKEIVEWETEFLGVAKVESVSNQQATGVMEEEAKGRSKVRSGDWVGIDRVASKESALPEKITDEDNENKFGKLGTLGLLLSLGQGEVSNLYQSQGHALDGMVYGLNGIFELWVTRNYWGGLELGKAMGSYKRKEGTLAKDSDSFSSTYYKIRAGYKYLPMGFFYGTKVDFYLGLGKYNFSMDSSPADGLGDSSFGGLLFGVKGGLPLFKVFRMVLKLEFLLNPSYTEDTSLFGESQSTSSYQMELGLNYTINAKCSFDNSLQTSSHRAKFADGSSNIRFKETTLRSGFTFTF